MPAPKRKPRSPAQKLAQHAENYGAGPADIAKMLDVHCAAEAPREVPSYDARIFDRFIKAIRELESAMNTLSDAGYVSAVETQVIPVYSEQTRKQIHARYVLNHRLYKEHSRPDRD